MTSNDNKNTDHDNKPNITFSTLALCSALFTMLFLVSSVFPYSGFLVMFLINNDDETIVTSDNVGIYAGILTSSYMIGRAIMAISWGSIADIYGRKIVLLVSLITSAIGSILFGLCSNSFLLAVLIRFTMGLCNGTMVVARTVISEQAKGNKEKESKGVATLFSVIGYSMLFSPAIGGLLSEPVEQHANAMAHLFQPIQTILAKYPFLLPNIIACILSVTSLILVIIGVEETLPQEKIRHWKHVGDDIVQWIQENLSKCSFSQHKELEKELSETFSTLMDNSTRHSFSSSSSVKVQQNKKLVKYASEDTPLIASKIDDNSYASTPQTLQISSDDNHNKRNGPSFMNDSNISIFLLSYWVYTFCSVAQSEAFPLFAMSTKGGLSLNETSIGTIVAISGLIYLLGQYMTFTTCMKQFGLITSMRYGALGASLPILLMPGGLYLSGWIQIIYLAVVSGIILIWGNVFLGCSVICLNQSVTAEERARMNGVSGVGGSVGRALGPIVAGYLVSIVMTSNVIPGAWSGWVIYIVLLLAGLAAYWTTLQVPDDFEEVNCQQQVSRRSSIVVEGEILEDFESQTLEV